MSGCSHLRDGNERQGINVAGYLRTESGLGGAARGYVRALQALDLPLALNDLSALSGNRSEDHTFGALRAGPPYGVSLVCADIEPHFAIVSHLGPEFFQDRYTIGVWAWELPHFPEKWHERFAYYDEIWVATSYIQNTLATISPVPIIRIPPVLTPPVSGSRDAGRRRLDLEDDDFVFLFIFDFHSHVERKNPLAVVDAFRSAFGPRDRARLILKCVNASSDLQAFAALRGRAEGYPIALYDGYWPAEQLRDLMAGCDAYVSLHRCEGTGLTVTDAMAMGKPTIATGWSGNMDFMTLRNSFAVEYELVEIETNVGPYRAGEFWAQPSVEHAAALMRLVYEHRDLAAARGEVARRDIEASYSESAVARIIDLRLQAIATRRRFAEYRQGAWAHFWDYQEIGRRIQRIVTRALPPRATVAVVSKGDGALLPSDGRPAWHFPRSRDGMYAGFHPADSTEAIALLETARADGAAFVIFPSTALWWLDYYSGFREHLDGRYQQVVSEPDTCLIYDIRGGCDERNER